jgi:hypothetical protein
MADLYDDDDVPLPPEPPAVQSNVGVAPPPLVFARSESPRLDGDLYNDVPKTVAISPPSVDPIPNANKGFTLPAPVTATMDGQVGQIAMVPFSSPDMQPPAAAPPKPPVVPPAGPPVDASSGIALAQTRRNITPLQGGRGKTFRSKKGGEIVAIFFNIRDQIKLYHWQTKSFAEHKATDDLVTKLDTSIDMFVEAYMGRYGRPHLKRTYPLKNLTVSGVRAFIARSDQWLSVKLPRTLKKTDTDLLNIRDEILADLNQIKYLFTLS